MDHIIFHVDLDAFFASIEIRDTPSLKGKPVIIGADPKKERGVVTTCSYEARKFGIHSAMPISTAYKLCPNGVYLHGNYDKYQEASEIVMEILRSYKTEFQQTSIDEAYLDITHICSDFHEAYQLAVEIQEIIRQTAGITCSIGCSTTKSIAKIASDYNKPNGITIVEPQNIRDFLSPMDITRIPGIGKKSKFAFYKYGIIKIADIYRIGLSKLAFLFGDQGVWIWNVIMGLDPRMVHEDYHRKSVGKERTFMEDKGDLTEVLSNIYELNSRIHDILEKQRYRYNTITLKIRLSGYITHTRSKTMKTPLRDKAKAEKELVSMFNYFSDNSSNYKKRKIRLVGVRFSNLEQDNTSIQTKITEYI